MKKTLIYIILIFVLFACATSPTGRKQFIVMPEEQMNQMGQQAFAQMKQEKPQVTDEDVISYVQCVSDAITRLPRVQEESEEWDVQVFDDKAVNAFALPGGNIGVFKGLLEVAKNQNQLAAVIGHEIGHVLAKHGNERVSQNLAVNQSLSLLGAWMAAENTPYREVAMTALGLGSQVGILLPFSRIQESEADEIGLDLMARAGFDPRESVDLWQNMAQAGGETPPEFLSTHPSHETRIEDLQKEMEKAMELYREAQQAGREPDCEEPNTEAPTNPLFGSSVAITGDS